MGKKPLTSTEDFIGRLVNMNKEEQPKTEEPMAEISKAEEVKLPEEKPAVEALPEEDLPAPTPEETAKTEERIDKTIEIMEKASKEPKTKAIPKTKKDDEPKPKQPEKLVYTGFYCSAELRKKIKVYAAQEDINSYDVIVNAVNAYFDSIEEKKKKTR